jgi:hypothetical protein
VGLKQSLIEEKKSILERWFHLILETYPPETSKFIRKEKDRFVNPVGVTLSEGMEALYEGLLKGVEADQISNPLEKILQIRSVQDFSPSQAVVIVSLLKKAIQEEMKGNKVEMNGMDVMIGEWFNLESRIDQLTLMAFDIYTKYRERVYEIRINEIKKERDRAFKLLERTDAKAKHRDPETGSG